jgi:hypothetical protein
MGPNYEDIRSYLLGNLAESERESIDLRIIEDEDFGVEARAVEDQLIESYIDGELNDEETANFRSNYLVSEARANKVRELAALRSAVARKQDAPAEPATGWTLSGLFAGLRPVPAFAGLAIIVLIGVAAWIYFADRPTALETEYAALNRSDLSDVRTLGQYTAVELIPGTYRSGDPASIVKTSEATKTILFSLPLTFDPPSGTRFRAEVTQEGKRLFSVPETNVVRDAGGSKVRVLLPLEPLKKKGQYQIILSQIGTENSPVVFGFTSQ